MYVCTFKVRTSALRIPKGRGTRATYKPPCIVLCTEPAPGAPRCSVNSTRAAILVTKVGDEGECGRETENEYTHPLNWLLRGDRNEYIITYNN